MATIYGQDSNDELEDELEGEFPENNEFFTEHGGDDIPFEPVIEDGDQPPTVPEELRMSIEVSLSEYSPRSLLELIAKGILRDIGGKNDWNRHVQNLLAKMVREKVEEIVRGLVEDLVSSQLSGNSGQSLKEVIYLAIKAYLQDPVDSRGSRPKSVKSEVTPRLMFIVKQIVTESIKDEFQRAREEWTNEAKILIRQNIADMMAERVVKNLNLPKEIQK